MRQLRLRDIGGIIVIDFIDMARARNRDQVLKTLRKALDADKTKSYVMEVSPLGLVEMTRQNVTDGVREILTKRVPDLRRRGRRAVRGDGRDRGRPRACARWSTSSRRAAGGVPDPGQPARSRPSCSREDSPLHELEEETGKHFHFEGGERSADRHLRGGRPRAPGRRSRSARCRSRSARRSWCTIEEPHMYNADDAVARVDSYIVSVTGGGPIRRRAPPGADRERRALGGDRVAGRRAERGEGNGADDAEGGAPNGDSVESPSSGRRRGRRGGRRRSRAGQSRRTATSSRRDHDGEQLRDSRDRRQAVPRREGHEPARRAPARGRGRQGQPARRHVPGRQGRGRSTASELEKVKVEAVVAEHLRGPKIRIFKYKPKKGYRRRARAPLGADPARGDRGKMLTRKPAARASQAGRRIGGAEGRGRG